MNFIRLLRFEVDAWESKIRPHIARVCERSGGRYETQHMLGLARSGDWTLFAYVRGGDVIALCGVEVVQYQTGLKELVIIFGTGHQRRLWQGHMEDVVAWGKSCGCTKAKGNFRKGWTRVLPNWAHTHNMMERTL